MRGLAYAKINLSLEITGKRADGYHELVSVMQTISLADSLSLERAGQLRLECDDPTIQGSDNLVLRAAQLLSTPGHFILRKRIPVAGGLGGGSSDGALALRLINLVYELGLSEQQLASAAAQLGSDVPFFVHGGTALVEGRGEQITRLPDLPSEWLVLVNPGLPLSTAAVYHELEPHEWTDGWATRRWAEQSAGDDSMPPNRNGLAAAACRLEPHITQCLGSLAAAGANPVLVSGSGPTCFGLVASEADAQRIARRTGGKTARFVSRAEALQIEL